MAIIDILEYPDERLKRSAKPVSVVDSSVKKMVDDMFETHYAQKNCAALAATQLNFAEPLAITVIDFSEKKDQPLCLINPEIVEATGAHVELEGCMSVFPEQVREKVKRGASITVRAMDREGQPLEFTADDFMAKCIQHETDHLHGLLFLDRLSKLRRKKLEVKINKILREKARLKGSCC